MVHLLQGSRPITRLLSNRPWWVRWGAYYAMVLLILTVGVFGEQSFIYFQF